MLPIQQPKFETKKKMAVEVNAPNKTVDTFTFLKINSPANAISK